MQLMEVEKQKQMIGANSDNVVKPNIRFKHFNDAFSGLTIAKNIVVKFSIISVKISYAKELAILIIKKSDCEFFIKQYNLVEYNLTFEEKIGGKKM